MRLIYSVPLALLFGACATPEQKPVPGDPPASVPSPEPERIKSQPLKHLVGRTLKPIPDRALEVRAKCGFRNLSGGRGMLDLQVTKADVKRFIAEVNIPKQGLCRFDLRNFQQTALLPNVVLTDAASGCVVHMWEQEKSVTVAFNACQSMCAGDAFSYLWPIVVDTRNGRCS
jgi:hypothetical protein